MVRAAGEESDVSHRKECEQVIREVPEDRGGGILVGGENGYGAECCVSHGHYECVHSERVR